MEIIRRGQLPSERQYTLTCPKCSTYFRCKESEGKVTDDQREGRAFNVGCPVCGHYIWQKI